MILNYSMLVQITTSTFGKAGSKPIDYLNSKGITFKTNPFGRRLTEQEAVEVISGAKGVIAGTEPLTEDVLSKLPDLEIISRCGTGLNNVDLDAAKKFGIKVFNTPTIHVDAVAELALTGTLSSLRKIVKNDRTVRTGEWKKGMGNSLYDKSIGIIGFGKVGRRFCELLLPFTSNLFFYDPYLENNSSEFNGIKRLKIDKLFEVSDIISLHVPYTEENHHMIDSDNLNLMKKNVTIVNTSRGGLINEEDLYKFLRDHPEAGAYLDVFETEPYHGKLSELENVILSPHVGTSTRETREQMELEASMNLINALENE